MPVWGGEAWEGWREEWGPDGMEPGLLATHALSAGTRTRPFCWEELLACLSAPPTLRRRRSADSLLEGAALTARARLARDHTAAGLMLHATAEGGLLVLRDVAAGDELLLWPDPALARAAGLPCLLPANIRAGPSYACATCPVVFSWPHPLKVHLLLRCGAPRRSALLRRLAAAAVAAARAEPTLSPSLSLSSSSSSESHRCSVCGKRYSRRYGLKIHLRTHSGHKPLRCGHCSRAFADPSNLNKHRRLHLRRDNHNHSRDRRAVPHEHEPHDALVPLPLALERANVAVAAIVS